MKQTLILRHKFPCLNDYQKACRTHWSKGHEMKKQWTDTVIQEVWAARLKPMGRVKASFIIAEPNDKRDPDNLTGFIHKAVLDGLVTARILQGDRWKDIAGITDEWKLGDRYEVKVILEEV